MSAVSDIRRFVNLLAYTYTQAEILKALEVAYKVEKQQAES